MLIIFVSYDEIVKDKVIYVAGGASQNTARGAAVRFLSSYSLISPLPNNQSLIVHPPPQLSSLRRLRRQRRFQNSTPIRQQPRRCPKSLPNQKRR